MSKRIINLSLQKGSTNFMDPKYMAYGSQLFQKKLQYEQIATYNNIEDNIETLARAQDISKTQRYEFIFLGRSNVGKSSLINSLTGQQATATSNYPGKTRNLQYFALENTQPKVILIDAPGYGFALGDPNELKQWGKMMQIYLSQSPFLKKAICLVDAEHSFKQTDKMVFELLEKQKRSFMVCFTKVDKIRDSQIKQLTASSQEIVDKFQFCDRVFHLSSVSREQTGITELKANIAFHILL